MSCRTTARCGRAVAVCATTLWVLLLGASSAAAHPFGPPPTALVSASGHQVVVEWGAPTDDALVVGMALGVLDDTSLERYLEGPVQVAPPAAKEAELSASAELVDYLLDRIVVTQDGRRCDASVAPIDSFLTDGARVIHQCPRPVTVVDLRIAMLHDVHDAYRTFAVTEGTGTPAQSVFTVERAEQRWDFTASPASGAAARPARRAWLVPVLATVLGLAGGALAWRRRSGQRS